MYAHRKAGRPKSDWHDLKQHLSVEERASEFARAYGAEWAYKAGLFHDLGKYWARFQERLENSSVKACSDRRHTLSQVQIVLPAVDRCRPPTRAFPTARKSPMCAVRRYDTHCGQETGNDVVR